MMYLYTGSSFKLCQALPCVIVDMLEVLNKAIHYLRKKGKKKYGLHRQLTIWITFA